MSENRAPVDETLEEHRECMQVVADVEACLDRSPGSPRAWLRDLSGQLKRLRDTMREHFEQEQKGQLYRGLPVTHPRLAGRLERLEAEHGEMLQAIERALARARTLEDPEAPELREFNARIQLLVARIHRHEAEENELVLEAHWGEIGTGD